MSRRRTTTMPAGHASNEASPRWAKAVASGLLFVYLAGLVANALLEARLGVEDRLLEEVSFIVGFSWFPLIGSLLIARQPRNVMGWLLGSIGLLLSVFPALNALASLAWQEGSTAAWIAWAAWPNSWYWFAMLGIVLFLIPLLFPDGRLPSRRWRPLLWVAVGSMTAICAGGAFGPTVEGQQSDMVLANPLHIGGFANFEESLFFTLALLVSSVGVAGSVVVRFRRSRGVERQQLKWFLAAVSLIPVLPLADLAGSSIPALAFAGDVAFPAVISAIPLSIGFALMRYRLYDIDRLISRTVAWGLLSAILVGLYLASVLVMSGVLRSLGGSSDLAVAASTLAVAAAFQPLRRRVQSIVDRRFNRERYDAARTLESFRARLRTQVDLADLEEDVLTAVQTSIAPSSAVLWLKEGPAS